MTKCEFRPASVQDAYEFYDGPPPFSFKGVVAVKEGKVVGVGGIYREGSYLVAFTDIKDEMRASKKDIARGCRMVHEMIKKEKRPVYTVANQDEPTAKALLAKLGFVPSGNTTPVGDILVWKES